MVTPSSTSTPAWMNKLVGAEADVGNGIAVDSVGNTYITGQIQTGTEYDAVLVKYNSSGTLQWQVTIGAASIVDVGYCITVDSSSNVYIGGQTGTTCILAKYNTSGTLIWQKKYGLANNDKITGITIDSSGYIYTTGSIEGSFIGLTRAVGFVCKYDLNGVIQFNTAIHYATANYVYIRSITIDTSGNIYVVGNVTSISRGIIIKLNSSGIKQWAKQLPAGAEYLYGVITDSSGNIYGVGTNTSHNIDIILVKFNSSGVIQWTRQLANGNTLSRNDSGLGICIDSLDKIYIIGSSSTTTTGTLGYDIFVAKYDTAGTQQWQRTIANSTASTDIGYAITATLTNIYITGRITQTNSDIFTACLPSDGTKVGTYVIGTTSMVYSSSTLTETVLTYVEADSLISSSTVGGVATLFNSGYSNDNFNGIILDSNNNIYLAGTSTNSTTYSSMYISKYDNNLTNIWGVNIASSLCYCRGYKITLDSSNNVYSVGYDATNRLLLVTKYDSNGNYQWLRALTSSNISWQFSNFGIKVDSANNLYIAIKQGSGTLTLMKYNSSGVLQWQKIIIGFSAPSYGLDIDSSGNLYITGDYGGVLALWKIDSTGSTILWKKQATGFTGSIGYAVKISSTGYIYVVGGSTAATAPFLAKYDSTGALQWSKGLALGTFGATYYDLTIDSSENIYCSGFYNPLSTNRQCLVTSYTSQGVCRMAASIGLASFSDQGRAIAIASNGTIHVAGEAGSGYVFLHRLSTMQLAGTVTIGTTTITTADLMSTYNFNTSTAGSLADTTDNITLSNGSFTEVDGTSAYTRTSYNFPNSWTAKVGYPNDAASSLTSGTASLTSTTVTI
jgi:uncharacterized delta-60 repeat protein